MSSGSMSNITGLDLLRFEEARRQAEDQIRASVPMPERARYTAGSFSKHPPAVQAGALLALTIVALAMFWTSAGKAIVAAVPTLAPMVESYGRLTPSWLN